MHLMERDATGHLHAMLFFPVIMNGECFLVIELRRDVFHVWNYLYIAHTTIVAMWALLGLLKVLKLSFMAGSSAPKSEQFIVQAHLLVVLIDNVLP